MATLTTRLTFTTSRPPVEYKYEDGDWQNSPIFEVPSGEGLYTFYARDFYGCQAERTFTEPELRGEQGQGSITINKTITDALTSDKDIYFKFSVDGPVSYSNILVSVNDPIILDGLPFGEYTITEHEPPTGYLNDSDDVRTLVLNSTNESSTVSFTNELDPTSDSGSLFAGPGSITFEKEILNVESLDKDVEFQINLIGPVIRYGLKVSVNTPLTFSNLPLGTYEVDEVAVPAGYVNHAVSPERAVLTEENDTQTVTLINSAGAGGPGQLELNKELYERDESDELVAIEDSDELFSGFIRGPLDIEGLLFSVNTPITIKNLPLGTYTVEENDPDPSLLLSITPLETTLTENNLIGEIVIANELGGADPEFETDIFYVLGTEPGESQAATTWRIAKMQIDLGTGEATLLTKADFLDLGLSMGFGSDNDMFVSKAKNGNIMTYMDDAGVGSGGPLDIHLFDSDWGLIKSIQETTWGANTTNTPQMVYFDNESNIYAILTKKDNVRIKKYNSSGVEQWASNWFEVIANNTFDRPPEDHGLTFFDTSVIFICHGVSGYKMFSISKTDGSLITSNDSIPSSLDCDIPIIKRNGADTFVLGFKDNFVDEGDMFVYNSDLTLNRTVDLASLGTTDIVLSGAQAESPAETLPDGSIMVGNVNDDRMVRLDPMTDTLIWDVGMSNPERKLTRADGNKALIARELSSQWGLTYFDTETGVITVSNNDSYDNADFDGDVRSPVLGYEDWQGDEWDDKPVNPTGPNTLTINKSLTGGEAADDDVEFTVNIYGPANFLNKKVSVNTPLVLEDLPDGQYLVSELWDDTVYDFLGVSPPLYDLSPSTSPGTVIVSNRKLTDDQKYATATFCIDELVEGEPGTKASGTFTISETSEEFPRSGYISLQYKGITITYNYISTEPPGEIAAGLVDAVNANEDFKLTAIVESATGEAAVIVVTEKRIGADFSSGGIFASTVYISYTLGSHIVVDKHRVTLTGGTDYPVNAITIYYPYRPFGIGSSWAIVTYNPSADTKEEVAQRVVDVINGVSGLPDGFITGTWNTTASRSDNCVTLTEVRAGPTHEGKEVRIVTNGETITITPLEILMDIPD